MAQLANVLIDPSEFPERVRQDLLESLRSRRIASKFHYESYQQARQWLRLHEAYSPARKDPDCARLYDAAFERATAGLSQASAAAGPGSFPPALHLVGLGTGGGQKEAALLKILQDKGLELFYTPTDVSVALALTARAAALDCLRAEACRPLVIDLTTATDLAGALVAAGPAWGGSATRLVTLFGILPNFEPAAVPSLLGQAVRPGDLLLLSANLAPGPDYAEGVRRVLPLYDNDLTRDWLILLLLDLGIQRNDGSIRFSIVDTASPGLQQIAADFEFACERHLRIHEQDFHFGAGERLRLFYSNRHTVVLVHDLLRGCGLTLVDSWTNGSGEEGVFLASRP